MSYLIACKISITDIRDVPWVSSNMATRICTKCKDLDIRTVADLLARWGTQQLFRQTSPFGLSAKEALTRWVGSLGIDWPLGGRRKTRTKLQYIDHLARTGHLQLLPPDRYSDITIPWDGGAIHILGLPNTPTEAERQRIIASLDRWLQDRVRS